MAGLVPAILIRDVLCSPERDRRVKPGDDGIVSMAQLHFTAWLREVVPDGPLTAGGGTVGDALAAVFVERPHVRSYLLDEQGRLRKHVCIFADGKRLPHAAALTHGIRADSTLYVMQALSGG
jgi:molybdopterin synthase sulfur carrier subunit